MSFRQFGGRQALSIANNIHTNVLTADQVIGNELKIDGVFTIEHDASASAINILIGPSGDESMQFIYSGSGEIHFIDDVVIDNNIQVVGNLDLSGAISSDDVSCINLYVSGDAIYRSNVDICGDVVIDGTITVSGDALYRSDVDICGDVVIDGTITVSGDALYRSDVDICGDVVIDGTITVSGDVILNNIDISGDIVIDGTITVSGDALYRSDMDICGVLNLYARDLSGALRIYSEGETDIYMGVTDVNTDIFGYRINANVSDTENYGLRFFGKSRPDGTYETIPSMYVYDSSSNIPNTDFLYHRRGVQIEYLDISQSARINQNLDICGNAVIDGELTVSGDTLYKGDIDICGNVVIEGELTVSGDALYTGDIDISGVVDLYARDPYGSIRIYSEGLPDIYMGVADAATDAYGYRINANISDISNFGMRFLGSYAYETTPSMIIYDSSGTLPSNHFLYQRRGAQVENLLVTNDARIQTDLDVCGNVIVDGTITVSGDGLYRGDVDICGDVVIDGKLTVVGAIDPTGLILDPQPSNPAAGQATLWVSSGNSQLKYEYGGLDISGVANIRDNATIGWIGSQQGGVYLTKPSEYGKPAIQAIDGSFVPDSLLVNPAGGNVGIGLGTGVNPTTKLEVAGDISCGTVYYTALDPPIGASSLYNVLTIGNDASGLFIDSLGGINSAGLNCEIDCSRLTMNTGQIVPNNGGGIKFFGATGTNNYSKISLVDGSNTTMRVEVNKDGFAQSAQFDFKYNELYLNNSGLSVEDGNFKVSQLTTIMKPDDFGNPPYTIYRPEGINVTQYYRITSTNRGSGALLYDIATASPVDTTFALLISYEGMPVNSYVTYKIILFNSSVSATPNIYLSISTFKDDAMTITNDCIINGSPRNVLLNQYQVLNTTNTTFARAIVLDMFRGADDTQDYLMLSRAETI